MPGGEELDALIKRAQEGDVRAFEALLAGHLPQVRRFARAFSGSDTDADDLAQEALLKVYRSLKLFRYQAAFSTWLYAVVRNVFLDVARSRGQRERQREDPLQPEHAQVAGESVAADERIDREQERRRLWDALRQVPEEFRSALVLFDIEGRTYDEVAAIEGVPIGTVKSRLSRGRAHLRRILGEPEDEPGTEGEPAPSNVVRKRS